jgi:GTPase SAR1 family protein
MSAGCTNINKTGHTISKPPSKWVSSHLFIVFIIGTAGSGKSLLTAAFSNWLQLQKQNVIAVNLDPGVITLPYTPDIDIRDHINIEKLMDEYKLGPNGALIMAADLIAEETERLSDELSTFRPDIALIDTPGQMELFAFRQSGPYLANELTRETRALIYLFDSVFSSNPQNYVSNLFLSAAVYSRFLVPQVYVLSKSDLLPPEEAKRIVDWSADPYALETAIDEKLDGTKRLLSRDTMRAVYRIGLKFLLIPVSAKTNDGFINLNTALERILNSGEKFTS